MRIFKKLTQYFTNLRRKQNEIYWGLVFNNAISDSRWLLNKSFYSGRWAAGYPLLYILFRIYNDIKPKSILEFGLGESTKMAAQYKKNRSPESKLKIIEQNPEWLKFFSNEFYDVSSECKLIDIEKRQISGKETFCYKDLLSHIGDQVFDFVVVDGPWGSDFYSRYQIVDIVDKDLLAQDFIIIIDDYERQGEKQTARELRNTLKRKNIPFVETVYSGDKDSLLVCSPKYKFLTSL